MSRPRVFPAVPLPGGELAGGADDKPGVRRADVVVAGLDLAGPSFELRVFVNNPRADADTEPVAEEGYAGSIHVYGYGEPAVAANAPAGSARPRMPTTQYVTATEAIRAAGEQGTSATVTLVPVSHEDPAPEIDLGDVEVSVLLRD
jgi:hypothetical protein